MKTRVVHSRFQSGSFHQHLLIFGRKKIKAGIGFVCFLLEDQSATNQYANVIFQMQYLLLSQHSTQYKKFSIYYLYTL